MESDCVFKHGLFFFFSRSLFKRKSDHSADIAHCLLNKDLHRSDRISSNKLTTSLLMINYFYVQRFHFNSQREIYTSGSIHTRNKSRLILTKLQKLFWYCLRHWLFSKTTLAQRILNLCLRGQLQCALIKSDFREFRRTWFTCNATEIQPESKVQQRMQ